MSLKFWKNSAFGQSVRYEAAKNKSIRNEEAREMVWF